MKIQLSNITKHQFYIENNDEGNDLTKRSLVGFLDKKLSNIHLVKQRKQLMFFINRFIPLIVQFIQRNKRMLGYRYLLIMISGKNV